MPHQHAVVWLDHSDAHVIKFSRDEVEMSHLHAHQAHQHLHQKRAAHERHMPPTALFDDVVKGLAGAREILVCGPGAAKNEFVQFVEKHHHALRPLIYGVETLDHPSEGELLKFARSYFTAADRMR